MSKNIFFIVWTIILSIPSMSYASTIYVACTSESDWDWLKVSRDEYFQVNDDSSVIDGQTHYNISSSHYQSLNKLCKNRKGTSYEPKAGIYSVWGSDLYEFNIISSIQPATTSFPMNDYTQLVNVVCSSEDRNYNVNLANQYSEQVTVLGSWVSIDGVDYFRTTRDLYQQVNTECQAQFGYEYAAVPEKENGNISHSFLIGRDEGWRYTDAELAWYDFNTEYDSHSERNPNFQFYVKPRFTNMTTVEWDEATVVCRPENQRINDNDWSYIHNLDAYPYQPEKLIGNWVKIDNINYLNVSNSRYQRFKQLCQSMYSTYQPLVIKGSDTNDAYNLIVTQ